MLSNKAIMGKTNLRPLKLSLALTPGKIMAILVNNRQRQTNTMAAWYSSKY